MDARIPVNGLHSVQQFLPGAVFRQKELLYPDAHAFALPPGLLFVGEICGPFTHPEDGQGGDGAEPPQTVHALLDLAGQGLGYRRAFQKLCHQLYLPMTD